MTFRKKPVAVAVLVSVAGWLLSPLTAVADSTTPGNDTTSAAPAPASTDASQAPSAPPASDSSTHQLGTVVVTAQRRAENIQEVPEAVTAVSGTSITDLSEGSSAANVLTRDVPDASAASPTPTRPRWWIRGVGTGAQGFDVQSPVGVYFDDVYFSNANATGQPIYDLDRVEILEGPQGTLWGKNTTGGAINFISAKPTFKDSGYAKIDESKYDDQLFEGAFGGGINDWLAGRASFHAESSAGAFKNAADDSNTPLWHDDDGRVQFLAVASPTLSALLNVHFRDYYSSGNTTGAIGTGPNGQYTLPGVTPVIDASPDHSLAVGTPVNTTQVHQDGAALTVTDQLERNTLTSITAFEGFETTGLTNGPTYFSPSESIEISDALANGDTHQLSEELRLASPKTDRDYWQVGTMLFTEDIDSYGITAILPNAATGVTPATTTPSWALTSLTQTTNSYSVFGNNTFKFTPKFDVTAGLRYTDEEKKDDYNRYAATGKAGETTDAPFNDLSAWYLPSSVNGAALLATQQASKSWGAWTYDLTPEYKINDDVLTYARIAHGFRSGGFNTTALTQAGVNANGGVVNPEFLTSYEAGIKSKWFDGQLIANGDVFYYNYDDIQVNVVRDIPNGVGGLTSTSVLTNAARGRADGVELNLEALPTENLHLLLATDWLNTKYQDYTTGIPGTSSYADYSGNHFVRSPHLSDVLAADYHLPLSNGATTIFGTDLKYESKQYYYGNDENDPLTYQDGYTLINAHLSYVFGKVTLTAYVNNLTDKLYKIHSGTPTTQYSGLTENFSTGRIEGASVTARF